MKDRRDRARRQSTTKTQSADLTGDSATELSESEQRLAEERTAPRAAVIHEAIRAEGESELQRPISALTWSGLAAGLSIGFSLVASGLIREHLPDTSWRPLIANLGYSVGFLAVILGRQQLYTENTLTVMLPLLTLRDLPTLMQVLRLWAIVLIANLAGACAFAWALASFGIFKPEVNNAFVDIASTANVSGLDFVIGPRNRRGMAYCVDGMDDAGRRFFARFYNRRDDLHGGARRSASWNRRLSRRIFSGRARSDAAQ